MEKLVKGAEKSSVSGTPKNVPFLMGDVVVMPFPFSDLSTAKKRPVLVLAGLKGDDYILCQITSQARKDEYSVSLVDKDFVKGKLSVASFIRPNRLFTADKTLIERKVGSLKKVKIKEVVDHLIKFF
ncbi:MAG: type II toxin-antitoxin system PemK/MazF family toxin [Nanoarchaeota archaeon]|nr:type II toxin-antitoxin system PemK/MazF family toxin [Nanoarchaeota archaeon]MBU1321291.1 type II toxin-antitoxin system PemK/MazF family toxin [Nanoarchaeota archaeon]MBU1597121.1 type II toxin-antitoxin system PemK/MazF family toxin [Nanoarchaeota archaeon]MBU2442136.1 type II toxin-antitoxin system PemK/MazF family toxin [Nanoarchaeota archaeon]